MTESNSNQVISSEPKVTPSVDEHLYNIDEEALEFMKSQTGIQDPEELKRHRKGVATSMLGQSLHSHSYNLCTRHSWPPAAFEAGCNHSNSSRRPVREEHTVFELRPIAFAFQAEYVPEGSVWYSCGVPAGSKPATSVAIPKGRTPPAWV